MAVCLSLAAAAGRSDRRESFKELAKRWRPILNAFDEVGVDVCYEIHPGEDVFDGATFEMFLDALKGHKRCMINYDPSHFVLMQLDYLAFIDIYHERIGAFTPRTPSLIRMGGRAFIPASSHGSTAPAASVRSVTGRWISPGFSPSWRNMAMTLGGAGMGMLPEASGRRRG